jgi:hypothetical protein
VRSSTACRLTGAAALAILACLPQMTGCRRLSQHPIVKVAVDEIAVNPRAAAILGDAIRCNPAVSGAANETDGIAALQFEAAGSKGRGLVVVEGKKLGDEWGVTLLELRPAGGGDHVLLTGDLEERTGTDTPKFDPAAATPTKPAGPPPGDIEIALPPGPP